MSDVFDKAKRSDVMSRIRSTRNRSTEVALEVAMRSAKITGWRRHVKLHPKLAPSDITQGKAPRVMVKPDFLFRKERLAVFVNGCFWHGCKVHAKIPATN